MSAREITQLTSDRLRSDWSADAQDDGSTAVDAGAMTIMRHLMKDAGRTRGPIPASDLDLLKQLRLVSAEHGSLTNAGHVLIGADDRFWPRIQYTWRETAGGEPTFTRTVKAPLVDAPGDALDLVSARLRTVPANLPDGVQRQVADFPIESTILTVGGVPSARDAHEAAHTNRLAVRPAALAASADGGITTLDDESNFCRPHHARWKRDALSRTRRSDRHTKCSIRPASHPSSQRDRQPLPCRS